MRRRRHNAVERGREGEEADSTQEGCEALNPALFLLPSSPPSLQHLYDVMDPDKDTLATRQLGKKELLDREYQLLGRVEKLLDKANYFKVGTC